MIVLGCIGSSRLRNGPLGQWREGWAHDAAAALLVDGEIVAAALEERATRLKHTGRFPYEAIETCLRHANIDFSRVDRIAFGEEGGHGPFRDEQLDATRVAALLEARFGRRAVDPSRIRLVDHHLAHAMSALLSSTFHDALVMTADGFGDGVSGLVIHVQGGRIRVLDRFPVESSLGKFYGSVLPLLGYGGHDEFKVMGLAPYGSPRRFEALVEQHLTLLPEGRFELDGDAFRRAAESAIERRSSDGPFRRDHRDLAAAVQNALEKTVFHVLRHHRAATGASRFACAGGVFQNSTMNGRILRSRLFDAVFVQPASSDCGLALGAAQWIHRQEAGTRPRPLVHLSLGAPMPKPAPLRRAIARWDGVVTSEAVLSAAEAGANEIADGHVIGWFQGRSEFGARALGNRSIVADPRPASMKDTVNAMVKMREGYRPFAPAVTEEAAEEFFDVSRGDPLDFMTFVVPVKRAHRRLLGAVTHVDGSARVQIVRRNVNPEFWALIRAFGERTGIPVVLNTSFNNNWEPIVDSVDDAIVCLLTTGLDACIAGNTVLRKRVERHATVAALVAAPARDMVLGSVDPIDGRAREHVIWCGAESAPRRTALSRAAFEVLVDDRGLPVGKLVAARPPAVRTKLLTELFALWERRFVVLTPPRSVRARRAVAA